MFVRVVPMSVGRWRNWRIRDWADIDLISLPGHQLLKVVLSRLPRFDPRRFDKLGTSGLGRDPGLRVSPRCGRKSATKSTRGHVGRGEIPPPLAPPRKRGGDANLASAALGPWPMDSLVWLTQGGSPTRGARLPCPRLSYFALAELRCAYGVAFLAAAETCVDGGSRGA